MKKILLTAAIAMAFAGIAAAEECPTLLCDAPAPVVAPCPPAPCPPAPPVCAAPPAPDVCAPKLVQVPVQTIVNETKVIPITRRVVECEDYVVMKKMTGTYHEERTRTAKRTVEQLTTKVVSEVRIRPVESCSGSAPRLTRAVRKKVVPHKIKVTEEFEETYKHPVKFEYEVPETKTRKVRKNVTEYKTVNKPKTVTVMETRLAGK